MMMKIRRSIALVLGCLVGLALLAACSGGDPPPNLSPEAAAGREVANSNGCASCHGKNGQGVTGPRWQGLYLSQVALDDGTTVIADDEYLYRAIADPQADIVKDWTLKMPKTDLDDDEIAAIIVYIKELT